MIYRVFLVDEQTSDSPRGQSESVPRYRAVSLPKVPHGWRDPVKREPLTAHPFPPKRFSNLPLLSRWCHHPSRCSSQKLGLSFSASLFLARDIHASSKSCQLYLRNSPYVSFSPSPLPPPCPTMTWPFMWISPHLLPSFPTFPLTALSLSIPNRVVTVSFETSPLKHYVTCLLKTSNSFPLPT